MRTERDVIRAVRPLWFPWETADPFLFCVHHVDAYPAGDERMAPVASLAGRDLGDDFSYKDGFSMYHGLTVPGFPQHPHRGFETVTVVRRGLIDHSDSLGATARFGDEDAQWLTAERGIVHAEMFPLLDDERDNPLELFQIWLNLPAADKFAEPHFSMLWNEEIPSVRTVDEAGRATEVTVVAGRLGNAVALSPPPASWASRPESDVAIWTIAMAAEARWTLPSAQPDSNRVLYFFRGASLTIDGTRLEPRCGISLRPDVEVTIEAGTEPTELLLLQGRPIGESVAQYGPFVMNTQEEIQQAFADYRRTQFGGWPWPVDDPVHAREQRRFAVHADGWREEAPGR